jgi:hypothetical protein
MEMGIEFKQPLSKKCVINIDLQNENLGKWSDLRYKDGKNNWTSVKPNVNGSVYSYTIPASKNVSCITLVNKSANDQSITIKKFEIVID